MDGWIIAGTIAAVIAAATGVFLAVAWVVDRREAVDLAVATDMTGAQIRVTVSNQGRHGARIARCWIGGREESEPHIRVDALKHQPVAIGAPAIAQVSAHKFTSTIGAPGWVVVLAEGGKRVEAELGPDVLDAIATAMQSR